MKPVPVPVPSPSPPAPTPLSSKEEDYESFTDNKVFFPITNKLIELIKPLNVESNVLFYIGSILRLVSILKLECLFNCCRFNDFIKRVNKKRVV
jgi:hypothetical protein